MADRRRSATFGWQLADLLPLALLWTGAVGAMAVAGLQRSVPVGDLFLDPTSQAAADPARVAHPAPAPEPATTALDADRRRPPLLVARWEPCQSP